MYNHTVLPSIDPDPDSCRGGGGVGTMDPVPPPSHRGRVVVRPHCATFLTEHDHWWGVGVGAKKDWNIYIYIYREIHVFVNTYIHISSSLSFQHIRRSRDTSLSESCFSLILVPFYPQTWRRRATKMKSCSESLHMLGARTLQVYTSTFSAWLAGGKHAHCVCLQPTEQI